MSILYAYHVILDQFSCKVRQQANNIQMIRTLSPFISWERMATVTEGVADDFVDQSFKFTG